MTDITALTQLCPPPRSLPRPVDRGRVEAGLGMRLPEDYKQLATAYGPGAFAGYIHVCHPHGYTEFVDLTGPMPERLREQLQLDHGRGTHPVPYVPRHLFAVGVTDNGENLFWITDPEDAPEAWRVAVNEARGPRWFTFDGTLTAFLTAVLSGSAAVPQFAPDLLDRAVALHPLEFRPLGAPAGPGQATCRRRNHQGMGASQRLRSGRPWPYHRRDP